MFKHKKNSPKKDEDKASSAKAAEVKKAVVDKEEAVDLNEVNDKGGSPKSIAQKMGVNTGKSSNSQLSVQELVEKNLKWAQIIYEQNRKINHKLFWMTIASWLRLLLIVVPIILALIYLPPFLKDVFATYGSLLGGATDSGAVSPQSIDSILKLLPLDEATQNQLKGMLK